MLEMVVHIWPTGAIAVRLDDCETDFRQKQTNKQKTELQWREYCGFLFGCNLFCFKWYI